MSPGFFIIETMMVGCYDENEYCILFFWMDKDRGYGLNRGPFFVVVGKSVGCSISLWGVQKVCRLFRKS
jgi:hypothetical protein